MNITNLPVEVLLNVFNRLPCKALVQLDEVNKQFKAVIARYNIIENKRIGSEKIYKISIYNNASDSTPNDSFFAEAIIYDFVAYIHRTKIPTLPIDVLLKQTFHEKLAAVRVLELLNVCLSESVLDHFMNVDADFSELEDLHIEFCPIPANKVKLTKFLSQMKKLKRLEIIESTWDDMLFYMNYVSKANVISFDKKLPFEYKSTGSHLAMSLSILTSAFTEDSTTMEFSRVNIDMDVLANITNNVLPLSSINGIRFFFCDFNVDPEMLYSFLISTNAQSFIVRNTTNKEYFYRKIGTSFWSKKLWKKRLNSTKHIFLSKKFIRKLIGRQINRTEKKIDKYNKEIILDGQLGIIKFEVFHWSSLLEYKMTLTLKSTNI